ncbi:glycosyltransferase family 2 protein [Nodosilinea sp. LEGE 07088]|uniref:glycosyltransferase family 2 protein n=1 Tax=Nodosilinea sp. LEGE 07088 TaxID=2777968 RepID=UPI001880B51A|nr:glycosyltransferase family 2 protein [Nodosilinea sp. LEGE 07088]MBE9140544.1 glycosyltransferase family 2 protein [Nodosilinea sp. LEGE 07088]
MGKAFSNLDSILVIIPVRNEADTLAGVIQALQALGLRHIRVIDNGSTDDSAAVAIHCGVEVIYEPRAGYGQACWRGLQQMPQAIRWVLFCDGDGSDQVSDLSHFLTYLPQVDFVLGNRAATATGRAALTPVQHFGNTLATALIWLGWGYRYRDLGPLRLMRRSALEHIQMQDRGFGWTVEMQVRAIECNLRICELPVAYRPRQGGQSKISGTLSGSLRAGVVILTTLGRLYARRLWFRKA